MFLNRTDIFLYGHLLDRPLAECVIHKEGNKYTDSTDVKQYQITFPKK